MDDFAREMNWIGARQEEMVRQVREWASINSSSWNVKGLDAMRKMLHHEFSILGGEMETIDLAPLVVIDGHGESVQIPVGKALKITKRPQASLKVFLGGHMDTVFAEDHHFQEVTQLDDNTLNGPGVADLKGGLAAMLTALMALERSPHAEKIGWEVLINPDEEIGSHGSGVLFPGIAERNHIGLIYEPPVDDTGTLAAARRGSGNFTMVVRGKAAHAGREFDKGRNAISLLGEIIVRLHALNNLYEGITLNVGRIEGGGALNIVPDLAIVRFNVRIADSAAEAWMLQKIDELRIEFDAREGYSVTVDGFFNRSPKPMDQPQQRLFAMVEDCGEKLGLKLGSKDTGGCCDGNDLKAAGLTNVDTLGVRGGKIHSDQEYMRIDSLVERAGLSALLLFRLASGDLVWHP